MRTIDRFAVGRWLRALVALLILAWATPSLAAGYWRYAGSATTPPQSQLDQATAGPGRTFEQKVNGAFQAAGSGAGTLNLSFKTDDVDRRVFLTTVTFSFTVDADMRSLSPGQKLRFHGVLTTGGNALAKALPSRGSGKMAAGNGDYFLTTESLIDQPASADGVFEVPRGSGQGDRLTIYAAGHIGSLGALKGGSGEPFLIGQRSESELVLEYAVRGFGGLVLGPALACFGLWCALELARSGGWSF